MQPSNQSIATAYLDEANTQLAKASSVISHCLEQLNGEQLAWRPHSDMNSIGNLIRHLCGNVQQWIIAGVGGVPDSRNRPREFADQGPFDRQELIDQLEDARRRVAKTLRGVSAAQLLEHRKIQGFDTTGLAAIFDSVAHFKGHTQEIVSLTRMQLGNDYNFAWEPSNAKEGAAEQ